MARLGPKLSETSSVLSEKILARLGPSAVGIPKDILATHSSARLSDDPPNTNFEVPPASFAAKWSFRVLEFV